MLKITARIGHFDSGCYCSDFRAIYVSVVIGQIHHELCPQTSSAAPKNGVEVEFTFVVHDKSLFGNPAARHEQRGVGCNGWLSTLPHQSMYEALNLMRGAAGW